MMYVIRLICLAENKWNPFESIETLLGSSLSQNNGDIPLFHPQCGGDGLTADVWACMNTTCQSCTNSCIHCTAH